MIAFNDLQFYSHLLKAVKGYPPQTNKCLQPQTFAVLFDVGVLNTPNLTQTISTVKKRMFYSRKYEAKGKTKKIMYEYPALIVFPLEKTINEVFGKCSKITQRFGLLYLDQNKKECKNKKCNYCGDRTIIEIERDTAQTLINILQYFQGLQYVNYQLDGLNYQDYFHQNEIDCLQAQWDVHQTQSCTSLIQKMKRTNLELEFQGWYGGIDDLYGTQAIIELCWELENSSIDFQFCQTEKPMQEDCC